MAKEKKAEHAHEVEPAVTGYEAAHAAIAELQLEELVNLKSEVEHLIGQKQKEQKKDLYAKMFEMAKAAGFPSVEAFVASQGGGSRAPRSDKGVKMPPKYQNKDKTKTWSGKGRKPDWVVQHLAAGGEIEALEIK